MPPPVHTVANLHLAAGFPTSQSGSVSNDGIIFYATATGPDGCLLTMHMAICILSFILVSNWK